METSKKEIRWRSPSFGEFSNNCNDGEWIAAVGEIDDDPRLLCFMSRVDDGFDVEVFDLESRATTEKNYTWPKLERVFPRQFWPRETYAGKCCKQHDATPDLRRLIDAEIDDYMATVEEEEDDD